MPQTEMTLRKMIETRASEADRADTAAHLVRYLEERGAAFDRSFINADMVLSAMLDSLPETRGVIYLTDLMGGPLAGTAIRPLSVSLVELLASSKFDIAEVVGRVFMLLSNDADPTSAPHPQLAAALTRASQWVSLRGLVRAARLVAGTWQKQETTELELLAVFLLTLSLAPWTEVMEAVAPEFATEVLSWHQHNFRTIQRLGPIEAIWEAALIPSDSLAPLPPSGKLQDFRLKGATFDWDTRCFKYSASAHFVGTELPPLPTAREILAAVVGEHQSVIHEFLPPLEGLTEPAFHTCLFPGITSWKAALDEAARVLRVPKLDRAHIRRFIADWQAIQQKEDERLMQPTTAPVHTPNMTASITPTSYAQIVERLEGKIVGHREVIRRLAMLADSSMRDTGVAARALLIGPSGSGKTTLLQELAQATGRVFVRIDASQLTENGWKGLNADHVAAMVVAKAGGDHEKARRALVVLDEVDKLRTAIPLPRASSTFVEGERSHEDPHGAAVRVGRQEALLSLLDPDVGVITYESEKEGAKQIETKDWLVICAGAFRGLEYDGPRPTEDDLVAYGFIPEFVSRMGQRIVLPPPKPEQIREILHSCICTAQRISSAHGKDLTLTNEALQLVAARVAVGQLSIRAAKSTLEEAAQCALIAALDHQELKVFVGPDEVLGLLPTPQRHGSRHHGY